MRSHPESFTKPSNIFFLVLPAGISVGFATVTLPYLLTQNGFSVLAAAGIVAVGVSANLWRFLWGPIADLTLSLKKWFWIGVLASTSTLLLLSFTPYTMKGAAILTIIVFISQVGSTLVLLPIGGLMAHRIEEKKKGRAAGWYQAGNLGGVGVGGGMGLWLATHYNVKIAGVVLCLFSLLFAMVVFLIKDVQSTKEKNLKSEMIKLGKDLISMVRVPISLFVIILLCLPIGTGSLGNVWSAIASDWKTNADTVALVTGVLSGIVSGIACVAGGYIADRMGVWATYLGFGVLYALVITAMTFFPLQPYVYITGVLIYSFSAGLCYTAFSAVILFAIGKQNAATKYSLLSSLGNLPVVYMTAFDGWAHDKFSSKYMMVAESIIGVLFIILSLAALNWLRRKKLVLQTIK
jgi:PAT family beta-lactamase induction signal transducer AmpG